MRIGVDARELAGRPTGAGRYLHGLLAAWAGGSRAAGHQFVLYAPQPFDIGLDPRRFVPRVVPGAGGTWWEQLQLPPATAADGLDVFFAPAYSAPLRLHVPFVVAMHDVSFAAHPEWYRVREGARRRFLARASARRASAVVTISEFSKREIEQQLGVASERVHVVPPGITRPVGPALGGAAGAHDEPRILYAGSIFNRRHVPDLIRAVARLARRRPRVSLDVVGDNRTYPRQRLETVVAAEGARAFVRCRAYVSDAELASLYASARAFAFLSEYEGLGLTPLEALTAGVPPVVSDTPVARESCGEAALYVPTGDLPAASAALEQVLFDEALRARLLEAAPRALAAFDWPRAADHTLSLLEHA